MARRRRATGGYNAASSGNCGPGWSKYDENCYRLYTTTHTWMDALRACQEEDSSLVDIGSEGEQTFVHSMGNNKMLSHVIMR
jgi:hypothetical protein